MGRPIYDRLKDGKKNAARNRIKRTRDPSTTQKSCAMSKTIIIITGLKWLYSSKAHFPVPLNVKLLVIQRHFSTLVHRIILIK